MHVSQDYATLFMFTFMDSMFRMFPIFKMGIAPRMPLPPAGHLAMPTDIFDCD